MLSILADLVWGPPTMLLMVAAGLLMTLRTRFVQVRRLGASFRLVGRSVLEPGEGLSSFQAVCTALAATVGTGNIAGVAGAMALGGPGAVFWMWAAALLGMATKYAEVVLAMKYRRDGKGGAMYCIRDGLGMPKLAAVFAFFAMLASLGMGNMAQVHTIVSVVREALPQLRPELAALVTGLLVALVTMGGVKRIGSVMEKLVPLVAAVYIFGSCTVLAANWQQLPAAFGEIFRGAFCPEAVMGGGIGQTIRWGLSRGVFSNEAGLGSAPMAHASASAEPEEQGLMGIFEVFVDTIVLCTLTALTILVSGVPVAWGRNAGAELVTAALGTVFGPWGAVGLAVCVTLLALGTLICWQFYGSQCAGYLFGEKGQRAYGLVYLGVILLGATMELEAVWAFSDLCNGLMALPNLYMLLRLRKEVPRAANGRPPAGTYLSLRGQCAHWPWQSVSPCWHSHCGSRHRFLRKRHLSVSLEADSSPRGEP